MHQRLLLWPVDPWGAVPHSFLPPFPAAPREWRGPMVLVEGGMCWCFLTWGHFTPWICILSSWVLETSFHHKHGLEASWIPAFFPLGTEEDPTCSSGNLLQYGSEVMWKWGVSYFKNHESVEGDTFGNKSGKYSYRKEHNRKQMAPLI